MIANNTTNQDYSTMLKWKDITIGMLQEIGELPDDLNPIERVTIKFCGILCMCVSDTFD